MLFALRRVADKYEAVGSKMLLAQPLVEGGRVFALDTVDLGEGRTLVGGYVDPAMDQWQLIDRDGNVGDSGYTTPAFIAVAAEGSQLRVLTQGCAAYAAPVTPPPVNDATLLPDINDVQRVGAEFVSLVGEDDSAAASLGPYGPDALWFPRQLADVLDSVGFDPSTAEEHADESSYFLIHPESGQRLTVAVGAVAGTATVLGYQLFGGCQQS